MHELQNAMSPGEQEPAAQPVVTVKQPSDVSSHVLGIGSTVLAGGRAFLGQGFTVMLLLFFFLASSESLLRRFVEILPRFDDKRRARSRLGLPACTAKMTRIGSVVALLLMPGTIMAHECLLAAPLILKETQSGVAGETGTVWTIAADCSFTIARQIGPKMLEPHKHGHLTSEQQVRLKEMLDQIGAMEFATLPARAPHVNPHRITVSYAGREAVLTLPSGGGDIGALRESTGDDRERSILELAGAMRGMLGR